MSRGNPHSLAYASFVESLLPNIQEYDSSICERLMAEIIRQAKKIEFGVEEFCFYSKQRCLGCNKCSCDELDLMSSVKEYSQSVQRDTDAEIDSLMRKGFSRDDAVMNLLINE